MEATELLDPFDRLLGHIAPPGRLRDAEAGGDVADLWEALTDSGFLDIAVPTEAGGAGLTLRDAAPLLEALGRHLPPVAIADTMVARALLALQGAEVPPGPIVLAGAPTGETGLVPLATTASHALVDTGTTLILCAADPSHRRPTGVPGSLAAHLRPSAPIATIARPDRGLRPIRAILRAAEMAGMAGRLLEMTIAYANDRVQFGKPIGRQQAVQQQLALLAEKTVMSGMAARIGLDCALVPSLAAAAVAKGVTSAAAEPMAAIAHAVHGAIGISAEHDLHLFTRRLHEWRGIDGSEAYWFALLGEARLAGETKTSADFVRALGDVG